MRKTTTKLTEPQQAFAAENHSIVYDFLRSKGLDEDYYDIVIFRYLHAVQIYDERSELRKYRFKTIAYNNMRSALGHHYESLRRMKRNATVLSLDMRYDDTGLPMTETVTGGALVYEYSEMRDAWERVCSALTPMQRDTVALRARGYSNREIAKVYNIVPGSVSGRMYVIRKKTRRLAA